MNYWGHPYGVSENIVVVYNSEKGMDAYFNMGLDIPFTGNRTNLVIIPYDKQTLERSPIYFFKPLRR